MNDSMFIAALYSKKLLSGDFKGRIQNKPTRAAKAMLFLDECISTGFYTNARRIIVNPALEDLLTVMEKYDDGNLQALASRFRNSM